MDYDEIYTELVFERNELIGELSDGGLLKRELSIEETNGDERTKHSALYTHRKWFREKILKLINELDTHDATEALYDFNKIELRECRTLN